MNFHLSLITFLFLFLIIKSWRRTVTLTLNFKLYSIFWTVFRVQLRSHQNKLLNFLDKYSKSSYTLFRSSCRPSINASRNSCESCCSLDTNCSLNCPIMNLNLLGAITLQWPLQIAATSTAYSSAISPLKPKKFVRFRSLLYSSVMKKSTKCRALFKHWIMQLMKHVLPRLRMPHSPGLMSA